MRKIAILVLSVMLISMLSVFGVSASAIAEPNPSGDYLKYTVKINKPADERLSFTFDTIRYFDYTIQEGDMLEYDVRADTEGGGWGAIDGEIEGVGTLRDTPGIKDQNDVGIHTGQDMSEYAYGKWYHRVLNIAVNEDADKTTIGKKLLEIQLAMHPESDESEYTGVVLYDNIVITNNGEVKLVIFKDAPDFVADEVSNHHDRKVNEVSLTTATVEMLTFSAEEIQGFADEVEAIKASEEQASIEASSRKESQEASRAEASASKQASEEEASRQASIEAENVSETVAANDTTAATNSDNKDEDGINPGLIAAIGAGVVVIIVVIVVIAMKGKKK